jgi:hypothetical protein
MTLCFWYSLIVARLAASAHVSPPWVVDRRKTRSRSVRRHLSSMISRRPASADNANPFAIPLPNVLSASWDELVGSRAELDRPIEAQSRLPTQITILRP